MSSQYFSYLRHVFDAPEQVMVEACLWPSECDHRYRSKLPNPNRALCPAFYLYESLDPVLLGFMRVSPRQWSTSTAYKTTAFRRKKMVFRDVERFTDFVFYDWEQVREKGSK